MPIATRPALALAACLLLAGCSALPNPLATATPPDALHPNPPVAAPVEQGGVQPTTAPSAIDVRLTTLQRQRATWQRAGILELAPGR